MTFENAAWAINGAELGAELARRALYATSRQSGIVLKGDLKVNPLGSPGNGLVITSGVGIVLNDYQNNPNEAYVVSNPTSHTVPAASMPPINQGSQKTYLVCVVVGDPDFDQGGHPFMTASDPPDGEETTFEYVRPVIIEVGGTGVSTLDVNYPALVLARLVIPAGTSTITAGMITDLRNLAMPRESQTMFVSPDGSWTNANPVRIPAGSAYANWGAGQFSPSVQVPSWAKRAIFVASINGVRLDDTAANVAGGVRAKIGGVNGNPTSFDYGVGGGSIRDNLQTGGEFDVTSIAGTSAALRVEGFQNIPASPQDDRRLALKAGSQMIFDVRFFEE